MVPPLEPTARTALNRKAEGVELRPRGEWRGVRGPAPAGRRVHSRPPKPAESRKRGATATIKCEGNPDAACRTDAREADVARGFPRSRWSSRRDHRERGTVESCRAWRPPRAGIAASSWLGRCLGRGQRSPARSAGGATGESALLLGPSGVALARHVAIRISRSALAPRLHGVGAAGGPPSSHGARPPSLSRAAARGGRGETSRAHPARHWRRADRAPRSEGMATCSR
jgi:hypothetical protein